MSYRPKIILPARGHGTRALIIQACNDGNYFEGVYHMRKQVTNKALMEDSVLHLPYSKGGYCLAPDSENAKRIRKCREKKKGIRRS